MKYKIKLFKAFLLLGTLFLFNCQPEQEVSYQEETTTRKLNIWKYPAEDIFKEAKAVKEKISTLKQKNNEARLTSSLYDFSIEESEVQVIYEATYTQYSFLIYRSIPVANVLENYICKVYNEGTIEQFLVAYPYTEDENGIVYDTQNATMQVIHDNSLNYTTTSRIPAGCVPEYVDTMWIYECVNVACSGDGHQVGESGCNCNGKNCTVAHTECDWISVNTWTISCPNNGGPGDTSGDTGGTGGGSTGTGSTTEDEIITVPVTMNLTEQKFIQSLNPDEFSCYSLNTTPENKNQIINYLNANKTDNVINPEAIEEVKDLTQAICENPNLNFDIDLSLKSPVNIDFSEIDTSTPEGQKLDCIYKKLTNSPEFKRLFEGTFGGDQQRLNIKFKMQANLTDENGNPVKALTEPVAGPQGSNGIYQNIIFNTNYLSGPANLSNISLAKTIIHEYIHAYLNVRYVDIDNGVSLTFLANETLEELMYYAFNPQNDDPLQTGIDHHDFMFNYMIPEFKTIFSEIVNELLSAQNISDFNNTQITDTNGSVIENFNFQNLYTYLAFDGLHNTQSCMDDIENNPIEKRKYNEYNRLARISYTNCQ